MTLREGEGGGVSVNKSISRRPLSCFYSCQIYRNIQNMIQLPVLNKSLKMDKHFFVWQNGKTSRLLCHVIRNESKCLSFFYHDPNFNYFYWIFCTNTFRRVGRGVHRVRSHPPFPRTEKVRLEVTSSAENVNLWKKNRQRWFFTVSNVLFCCRSLKIVFVLLIYLPSRTDYERIGSSIQTVQ